jgi:SAM-dependent methyltransferase
MRHSYIKSSTYLDHSVCLEISPLASPVLDPKHANSRFLDICSQKELQEKYSGDATVNKEDIVPVHYVHHGEKYSDLVGNEKFGLIVACHVIEHVPNVLKWLNELAEILAENGEIKLIIPDQRYCFDFTRRLTGLSDIVGAFLENRTKPTPERVYDHFLHVNGEMNDATLHHQGKYSKEFKPTRVLHERALLFAQNSLHQYIDTHCSVWTPDTFREQMIFLSECNMLHLELIESEMLYTPLNSFEFYVTFRRK